MKNIHSLIKPLLLSGILIAGISIISRGQVGPGPPPAPGPSSSVPLDPLSWILLGAGATTAAGKYYQTRKKR